MDITLSADVLSVIFIPAAVFVAAGVAKYRATSDDANRYRDQRDEYHNEATELRSRLTVARALIAHGHGREGKIAAGAAYYGVDPRPVITYKVRDDGTLDAWLTYPTTGPTAAEVL